MKVKATAVPAHGSSLGVAEAYVSIPPHAPSGKAEVVVPYDLGEEPMEVECVMVSTERRQLRTTRTSQSTTKSKTDYYLIEVVPPQGWTVQPAQLKLAESTTQADFVLTPRSESR